jgi:hypothetical protein
MQLRVLGNIHPTYRGSSARVDVWIQRREHRGGAGRCVRHTVVPTVPECGGRGSPRSTSHKAQSCGHVRSEGTLLLDDCSLFLYLVTRAILLPFLFSVHFLLSLLLVSRAAGCRRCCDHCHPLLLRSSLVPKTTSTLSSAAEMLQASSNSQHIIS